MIIGMASPTAFTSHLRGKLDSWSDDDEDVMPVRAKRSMSMSKSMSPVEDLDRETVSPAEPSSPKLPPARKRIARAPCLDSDDDDEEPHRYAKVAKLEPSPPSPRPKLVKEVAGPVEAFSPPREISSSRAHRPQAP